MANQIVVSSGAKVRNLEGVLTGTSGVVSSVPLGAANGVATLDSGGKVPVSQLPNSVMEYQGTWNANTNTPTLANGTGNAGDFYLCNVAGTTNFGAGPIAFIVGDSAIYSGSIWQKSGGATGSVTSVAASITGNSLGITGSPITTAGTLAFAFAGTNLQYINGAGNLTTFPTLSGYVTSVTGTAPVVSSGGTTPAISMAAATTSVNGYLSATDFAIFNAKQSALTFSSPLVNTSGTISIPAATTSVNGYLASADFTTFNNKQNAITLTTTGTSGAATLVGATLNIPNYGSGLTGYVPYTGATQDVDLGAFKLNAQSLHAKGTAGNGHLGLKHQSASATASANEVSLFADSLGDLSWLNGNLYLSKFITSGNTAARSYTFPNANGTIALLSSLSATSPIFYNSTTGVISSQAASSIAAGYITIGSQDIAGKKTFYNSIVMDNGLTGEPLEFKQYSSAGISGSGYTSLFALNNTLGISFGGTNFILLNSVTLTSNRTYTFPDTSGTIALVGGSGVGTVTSVSALTLGTTGTDLSSTVANSTTTPVITLNVPTASATNRGALSSADWTTFNNKQAALTNPVTGTGTTNYLSKFTGTSAIGNSSIFDNGTNVGIGNTNTTYKLDVSGTGRFTGNVFLSTGSGNAVTTLGGSPTGNDGASLSLIPSNSAINWAIRVNWNLAGALEFCPSTAGGGSTFSSTPSLYLSSTGAATFSSSVNVTSNLTVSSAGNIFTAATSGIFFNGSGSYTVGIYNDNTGILRFDTASTERMRITSGGDVTIGIATAATNVQLNINGYVNKAGRIQFQESGVSKWLVGNGAASENGRFEIYDNTNGTGVQLLRGATSWTALSDERFKDIIEPISVNNKLKNVRAVIGKYKTDNEGVRRNFLIAQDLLKVFPEVVDVDEDETKPMGVRYQDLIPVLVKAIQEQQIQIQNLQEQINILAK